MIVVKSVTRAASLLMEERHLVARGDRVMLAQQNP